MASTSNHDACARSRSGSTASSARDSDAGEGSGAVAATGRTQEDLLGAMLRRAPIDVGRPGEASEVAAAIAFLCSEQAAWISGTGLLVDGGTVRSVP